MSRSRRALAEGCAWTMSALRGLGRRLTDTQGSGSSDRIGADPPLTHLKWMTITSVIALSLAPATALGNTSHHQSPMTKPKNPETAVAARAPAPAKQTLAPGAGYAGANGSASVRALQRKLIAAGFSPGPIDGLYGPLTERAVIRFQAAHGLQIDGIAGPQTLGALARPVLYPEAGYADVNGSASVRALQRKLIAAGFSPWAHRWPLRPPHQTGGDQVPGRPRFARRRHRRRAHIRCPALEINPGDKPVGADVHAPEDGARRPPRSFPYSAAERPHTADKPKAAICPHESWRDQGRPSRLKFHRWVG